MRFNGTHMFLDTFPTFDVQTDACPLAAGAFFRGDWLCHNFWCDSTRWVSLHINHKETLAIILAAKRWSTRWANQHVIIHSIQDTNLWMTANKLKLNNDKTDLLVFTARHRPQPMLKSIYGGTDLVNASESARNIGVCFDNLITIEKQITLICKSAFYQLHNIAKIRKFISSEDCETLIHAFVSTKLDYCNSLLSGLSQSQIQKLQYVQNSTARLLTGTRKYDSITPILKELHWLPVAERIHYKIFTFNI